MKNPIAYFIILFALLQWGCATTPKGFTISKLADQIHASPAFAQNHTGMALYDMSEDKMIFQQNAERYFTPASNTKLYTFFSSLKTLGDSIPALKYIQKGDSLIFWGTGDPSFLHPDLKSTRAYDFLKNRKEKLFYSNANDAVIFYGSGWTWNDYNDYYQAEISAFPVYGNIVRFTGNLQSKLQTSPNYFQKNNTQKADLKEVERAIQDNSFAVPVSVKPTYEQDVPFKTSAELTQKLLEDTLHKTVTLLNYALPKQAKILYSLPVDSVYTRMLHVSDNMLAEQLMVLCSGILGEKLNTTSGIDNAIQQYMTDLPDSPKWVDGSGLSRYNLFTPRTTVQLLRKIYAIVPQERLFSLLAAGGKSGTIRNMNKDEAEPYIFAKSGSLSNNYSLSGYLRTKSGKMLIFSLMNNNFVKPASEIRKEVERFLQLIHANY